LDYRKCIEVSLVLFLFFNADLVTSKLNRNEGAMALVDDYTAWVTDVFHFT
jgi:hypothetical protein